MNPSVPRGPGRVQRQLVVDLTGLPDGAVAQIEQAVADILAEVSAPGTAGGWTAAAAQSLCRALRARGRRTQVAALTWAAHHGGIVTRDEVYELGGYTADRSLTGFTRPVLSVMRGMAAQGQIQADAKVPLRPVYDTGNAANQKASAFRMPEVLIPFFRTPEDT